MCVNMSEKEKPVEIYEVGPINNGTITLVKVQICPKCGNVHKGTTEPDGIEKVYLPTVV